ncbi:UDP-N-acetylmuramoyl-L-alanine--D-glutamate ligase, partial [Bacteroidota bacterium]
MGKKLAILGAGESGFGSAILGISKGFDVFLSDNGQIKSKYKDQFKEYDFEWEENKHSNNKILDSDIIVKSPGIPESAEIVVKARALNIPVISEIEFGGRYTDAKMICISG